MISETCLRLLVLSAGLAAAMLQAGWAPLSAQQARFAGAERLSPESRGFLGTDLSGSHPISFVVPDGDPPASESSRNMRLRPLSAIQADSDVRLDAVGKITCHDREGVLERSAFPEHSEHVVELRASCATCHSAHGSVDNRALIHFDEETLLGAVAPSFSTGRLAFVSSGAGSNGRVLEMVGTSEGWLSVPSRVCRARRESTLVLRPSSKNHFCVRLDRGTSHLSVNQVPREEPSHSRGLGSFSVKANERGGYYEPCRSWTTSGSSRMRQIPEGSSSGRRQSRR